MSTANQELLITRDGNVLTCTLNREERRNALNFQLTTALKEALEKADLDPGVRVICLTGVGERAFCAGGDLVADLPSQGIQRVVQAFADLVVTMDELGKPILARVNGHCLGGGLGLMLSCDLAIACEEAQFGTPEVRSGLFPMIIAPLIVRHTGPKRAMEMIFTGRRYSAAEAQTMGLINRTVARSQLDTATNATIAEILAGGPAAISMGRRAMARTRHLALQVAVGELAQELQQILGTEDAAEGIAAFLEKRAPVWKSR